MKSEMKEFTQEDLDRLADIIWWIMGFHAGAKEASEHCSFHDGHIESLRKARNILKRLKKEFIEKGNIL